jgi:myosin-crossreactive antigen
VRLYDRASCYGRLEARRWPVRALGKIAKGRPEFGNPQNFSNRIEESEWESFSITFRNPHLFGRIQAFTGNSMCTCQTSTQPRCEEARSQSSTNGLRQSLYDNNSDFKQHDAFAHCNGKSISDLCRHRLNPVY